METEVFPMTSPLRYFARKEGGIGLLMSFSTAMMDAEPLYDHVLRLSKHIHTSHKYRAIVAPVTEPDHKTATGAWQVEIVTDPLPDDEVNTYRAYIDVARKNGAVGVLIPFFAPESMSDEEVLYLFKFRDVLAKELSVKPIVVVIKTDTSGDKYGTLRLAVTDTGAVP